MLNQARGSNKSRDNSSATITKFQASRITWNVIIQVNYADKNPRTCNWNVQANNSLIKWSPQVKYISPTYPHVVSWLRRLDTGFTWQSHKFNPGDFQWDSWWMKWYWRRFFSKFLWFSPVNHHSTTAPYSSITAHWCVQQP
jgi:hypothetical protein